MQGQINDNSINRLQAVEFHYELKISKRYLLEGRPSFFAQPRRRMSRLFDVTFNW